MIRILIISFFSLISGTLSSQNLDPTESLGPGGPEGEGCNCLWFWGPNSQAGEIGRLSSIKVNTPGTGFIVNGAENNASSWGGPWYGLSRGSASFAYENFNSSSVLVQGFYGIGLRTSLGRLTLNQNGAVTIGLSDSEIQANAQLSIVPYRLYVKGGIRSDEVLVDLVGSWPDYVFHDSYKLLSLNDLKSYINNENHLPGLQPAAFYKANGINLGELNTDLVKKIEELTLYIIKLNDEIETLKQKIK